MNDIKVEKIENIMNEIIEEQKSSVYNLTMNNDIHSKNIKCSKKKTIELVKKERLYILL